MIWLASGSPRRRQLLAWAGYALEVHPSHADETRQPGDSPVAHAERLARRKALSAPDGPVVLAADTVVHRGDDILDKPHDRAEARAHLVALSGREHAVTTGVCLRRPGGLDVFHVTTVVRFRPLHAFEIDGYLLTGEADDKAGAYGIQGRAAVFVEAVRGSWTNVVGLPMEAVVPRLDAWGVPRGDR